MCEPGKGDALLSTQSALLEGGWTLNRQFQRSVISITLVVGGWIGGSGPECGSWIQRTIRVDPLQMGRKLPRWHRSQGRVREDT